LAQPESRHTLGQVVDVSRQIVGTGFLAGLDQDHAAGVRQTLFLQRENGGQRAEDCVAVVGTAAAVQLVTAQHRLPRTEVIVPAGHFRLLVQVTVEQHGVVAGFRAGGRDFQEDQRGAAFQADHFDQQAGDVLRLGPALHQVDGLIHVAIGDPIGVEHRRLVGDADVIDQLRDDIGVPLVAEKLADLGAVHVELR
jgi:hypothetical protein